MQTIQTCWEKDSNVNNQKGRQIGIERRGIVWLVIHHWLLPLKFYSTSLHIIISWKHKTSAKNTIDNHQPSNQRTFKTLWNKESTPYSDIITSSLFSAFYNSFPFFSPCLFLIEILAETKPEDAASKTFFLLYWTFILQQTRY